MISQDLSKEKEDKLLFRNLFDSIDNSGKGYITKSQLMNVLNINGIMRKDKRIGAFIEDLNKYEDTDKITLKDFISITHVNISIIERIIKRNLIIPNFIDFSKDIKNIIELIKKKNTWRRCKIYPTISKS